MRGRIYIIENQINNKKYIGCTYYDLSERMKEHIKASRNFKNRPLYSDFYKYGMENFIIYEIEECEIEILVEREEYWIKHYDTFKKGYNLTLGGRGVKTIEHENIVLLYQQSKNINKVSMITGHDSGTIRKILKANNIETLGYKKKVCGYDIITEERIGPFKSQTEAGKWLQKNKKTTCKNAYHLSYAIGRAIRKEENREQCCGYRWEHEE